MISFTSDEDTDESNITSGFQFHPLSSLPSRTASTSLFTDYLGSSPEDSPLVSSPTQLSCSLDWDVVDALKLFKPPSMHNAEATVATVGSVMPHYDYNTKNNNRVSPLPCQNDTNNNGMSLLPSHDDTTPLLSTVDADAETAALDAALLKACFDTGVEVLDLFSADVDGVAANSPSSNTMADDPSSLVISFEHEQQVQQQQFDQQELQLDYLLKEDDVPLEEDVADLDPSQLHCCGICTSTSGVESNVDEIIIPTHPTRLSIPPDEQFLDPVHNFLRTTCIEVFVDNDSKTGQVGLRCVYCKHADKRKRANQAVSYPSKTASICESMRNFQRTHLEACEFIPYEIKTLYRDLVSQTYRKMPLKYIKVYVAEAACELGIVQTPNGLVFGAPPNTSGKPSEKLRAIMRYAENPAAYEHLKDVIFPKVDDRLKKLKFSHIASEKTRQVIANCRKTKAAFVYPSDFATLSDLCFVLYHQFIPCRPPETALARRETKPEKWDTLSGLCCKYCAEAHPGERHHKGMYFPLALESLHDSSSSFAHNVTVHAMTCQHAPLEIKEALEELQRLAAEHGVTTKRGSKQTFMKKLWERMANYYPAPRK